MPSLPSITHDILIRYNLTEMLNSFKITEGEFRLFSATGCNIISNALGACMSLVEFLQIFKCQFSKSKMRKGSSTKKIHIYYFMYYMSCRIWIIYILSQITGVNYSMLSKKILISALSKESLIVKITTGH